MRFLIRSYFCIPRNEINVSDTGEKRDPPEAKKRKTAMGDKYDW